MKLEKIIFLDIDGVLNPTHYLNALFKMWKASEGEIKSQDEFGYYFFPQNCDSLKRIINETGAKLVISSEWRKMGKEKIMKMWKIRNLPGEVVDITPTEDELISEGNFDYLDLIGRGTLIEHWIKKNKFKGKFVIIDDTFDFLDEQVEFLIETNGFYGLTNKDAEKAIGILNGTAISAAHHSESSN